MRYLKLTIAYDGTNYVGWQIQNNGLAIQEVLEKAWTSVTQEKIRITASGRTDSGVHALAQVCSLATESSLPAERLPMAINSYLPMDVRVLTVQEAPVNFHAIRDATSKTYRYQIQTGRIHDVFQRQYRWFIPVGLNFDAMQQATPFIMGKHDFSSFEATGASREDSIRTVTDLSIKPYMSGPFQVLDIEVTADGFLYNMVRNIVGTLVVIGRNKQNPEWVETVIQHRDRKRAGETAPAHGLFLVSVVYGA